MTLRSDFTTGGPERDVGDEVAVHHIDVNDRTAAALGCSDLFREPCEVCRQYRGQQFNHGASVSAAGGTVQAVTAGTVMAAPRATREMARTSVLCGIGAAGVREDRLTGALCDWTKAPAGE